MAETAPERIWVEFIEPFDEMSAKGCGAADIWLENDDAGNVEYVRADLPRPTVDDGVIEAMCRAFDPAGWGLYDGRLAAPNNYGSHSWARYRMARDIDAMRRAVDKLEGRG